MAKLWRVTREISANVMGNEAYLACILKKEWDFVGKKRFPLEQLTSAHLFEASAPRRLVLPSGGH